MTPDGFNWLRTARIFAFESWWPPFWPHLEVDWDRALWTMQRLHLDTLQANALTKWAFYPTDLVQRHPELGDHDMLLEAQDFCAKHGYRWIIYTLFGHAMPISTQLSKSVPALFRPMIPDSYPKTPGHKYTVPEVFQEYFTQFHFGGERYVAHCPFAAEPWLLEMVGELADRYDYDATWLDGSISIGGGYWLNDGAWNICICPTCQRAYEEEFNRPMPIVSDLNDPRMAQLRRWDMKRLDVLLSKVVDRYTKGRTVPLIGNVAGGTGEGCFYPPILKNLNGGLFEHAPDQIDLVLKVSEARQIVDTAIHYPDCYDPWPRLVTSGWEVENKGLTILAYDGTPYLAMPGKYYYDDSNDEPAERVFAFMEKEKGLLSRQRRYAYCAVPSLPMLAPWESMSYQSTCARGWVSCMLDQHVPVAGMPFHVLEDIDRLRKYPALILADYELMSENGLRTVRSYVEEGGGVYISVDPARFDENRQQTRAEVLLENLDLHWRPLSDLPQEQRLRRCAFEKGAPLNQTYDVYLKVDREFEGDFPVPGNRIQPSHFGQTAPGDSWSVVADLVPTDEDRPLFPAVAVRTMGKGRLVFSSVAWGKQYGERRDPILGQWMRRVVEWLGNEPLPVQLRGSRLLQLGTTRVADGWLLYLVNSSNDVQGRRQDWWEMMKVAERPLPIGPVEISVDGVERVETVYGHEPDEVIVQDGSLQIGYTDFQDHAVLHAY